jgi:vacuolar protein sorting-associated protein VTA1
MSSPALLSVPPLLKPVTPYIKHSQQLEKHDSLMAYYCRYYAAQLGIKLRQGQPGDAAVKKYLHILLDQLEADKKKIGTLLDEEAMQKDYVEGFALKVFDIADNEDRAGHITKDTAKNFYASSVFFDVLKQFGDVTDDITEKQKYAKWRAAEITKAIKSGVPPPLPPSAGSSPNSEGDLDYDPSTSDIPRTDIPPFPPDIQPFPSKPENNTNSPSFPSIPPQQPFAKPGNAPDFANFPSFPSVPSQHQQPTKPGNFPEFPSFPPVPPQNQTPAVSQKPGNFPDFPSFPNVPTQQSNLGGIPDFPSVPFPTAATKTVTPGNAPDFPNFPNFPNQQVQTQPGNFPDFPPMPQQPPTQKIGNIPDFPNPPSASQQPTPPVDFAQFPSFPQSTQNTPQRQNVTPKQHPGNIPDFPPQNKSAAAQQQHFQQNLPQAQNPMQIDSPDYVPSEDDKELAHKYSRFAVSALHYDDVPTAVKNLKLALKKIDWKRLLNTKFIVCITLINYC